MSYTDAVGRVGQIQQQLAALATAFAPAPSSGAAPNATAPSPGAAGSSSFAAALAQAQAPGSVSPAADVGQSASLPAAAAGRLTSGQQQFASRLAADTGLDPAVISAWLLAEENGGAAQSRQAASNNDWLNIGYTDSGTFGAGDSVWSDPLTAADATAGWLKGQNTIPGYGTASGGIQAILRTAGQAPQTQIAAIQQSGWASSGYPDLPSLYHQVSS